MGGSITAVVRFPNGRISSHKRWTNNIPIWVKHSDFFNNGPRVKEFGRVKGLEKFPVVPSEYGIIVFDYKTNTIIDANHYMTVNMLHPVHIFGTKKDIDNDMDVSEDMECLSSLLAEKRIHVRKIKKNKNPAKRVILEDYLFEGSLNDLLEHGAQIFINEDLSKDAPDYYQTYRIDTHPMTYLNFNFGGNMSEVQEKLLELGFKLDQKEWDEYFADE